VRLYHEQMVELDRKLFDTFSIGGIGLEPTLDEDDLDAFRTLAGNDIDAFLDDSCVVLEYLHRRGVQQLVLEAMRLADALGGSSRTLGMRAGERPAGHSPPDGEES